MCLSSVYNRAAGADSLLLRSIQNIRVEGDELIFTDVCERETRLRGRLISADLVNGCVIVDAD